MPHSPRCMPQRVATYAHTHTHTHTHTLWSSVIHIYLLDRFYIAPFYVCSRADLLCSCRMWFWMRDCAFYSAFWISTEVAYSATCCMADATWNGCYIGARSVYTIQPCTCLQCHFIRNHIRRVHVGLAVTCHLHFWQNDTDLLHATEVTREGLEPGTFRSRGRRSTTELYHTQ